jgi:hypothetical protein
MRKMKAKLILIVSILLFANCVHITVSRLDYLYPNEIQRDKNNPNLIKLGIKFGHSMWTTEYFAKDTVADSIYKLLPKNRKEYYKKIGYFSIRSSSACGFNRADKIEFPDTSLASITEINYEDSRFGYYDFKILFKDTGSIPILFYTRNIMLKSSLCVCKDSVYLRDESRQKYERIKWPFGFLWLIHLWPFWPSFY